jgi:HlyD family secretion protein
MSRRGQVLLVLGLLAAGGVAVWALDPQARLGLGAERNGPLTLYGNVDIRQVELGFRVPGRIETVAFEEGDRVAPHDLLARLDARPYEDDLRLAAAEVARAEAELAKLEAGTRPAEIEQARALVAEREASLANAQRLYERRARLVGSGAVSRQEYDDALALLDEARARKVSAERALDLALEGFRSEEIAAARATVEAARARLASAETALADAEIHAPAGGVILSRVREPGAIVAQGETVLTLSLERPVWVRAYVPGPALGLVHPGQAAEVVTDTRPERPYHGQIGFISPVAEFTPKTVETPELRADLVYRLRVVVEDADVGLRQGMPVTVRLPDARPVADAGG